ncbi:UNVERIFIED_CONTAM: hypothetical protein Slati_2974800 [Sesamum latifolium]|uniref:Uncharacterized protein n=1 Tax=Sesamum latifolium TaxID=2727402 RepID=A0AAW2VGA4_9LAMI
MAIAIALDFGRGITVAKNNSGRRRVQIRCLGAASSLQIFWATLPKASTLGGIAAAGGEKGGGTVGSEGWGARVAGGGRWGQRGVGGGRQGEGGSRGLICF